MQLNLAFACMGKLTIMTNYGWYSTMNLKHKYLHCVQAKEINSQVPWYKQCVAEPDWER